ncbi:MAG TPA: hypothetical protein VHK90_17865 [Thermoanaerobaculia bacterium]|nr:hypothetical protein [Thermoanaerobaculia bacterium]
MTRLLSVLLLLGFALPGFAREGFGFYKKSVEMTRTVPPSTNAGARRVKVEVAADRGDVRDDAKTLERYITEHILSGSGTLADSGKSEVDVIVTLDRLFSEETWNTETEYVRQQTGTKQKWNEKKQKMETEPIYSNVPVQKQYKVVTASLTGSFEIAAKNADVASGQLDEGFRRKYGDDDTSPAPSEIEDDLLRAAAKKIASYLVPTQERVSVLVPRASFEPLIPLAESGAWDRYLAAAEAVPPRKNVKDEAYRQYALAIAKEAIAYQTDDRAKAIELLRAASSHYEVAAATNPGEELFRKGYTSLLSSGTIGAPLARITESVNRYDAWTSGGSASAVRVASTTPTAAAPAATAPAKQGMRNQTVIDLAKAGLSDENIMLAIDAAERTEFDVSPDGLIALAKGGVSKDVIAHMQKKKAKR